MFRTPNTDTYLALDRAQAKLLVGEGLVLTSPHDDHIDQAAYFANCFPTADRLQSQILVHLVELDAENVLLAYEYRLRTGERHRNTEIIAVRRGQVHEIQVFFGGRVG